MIKVTHYRSTAWYLAEEVTLGSPQLFQRGPTECTSHTRFWRIGLATRAPIAFNYAVGRLVTEGPSAPLLYGSEGIAKAASCI